jgi:hypothetical protein
MTMHLVGPYMTTTNYKKRKQKKLTNNQQERLELEWKQHNKRMRQLHMHDLQFSKLEDYLAYRRGQYKFKERKSESFQVIKSQEAFRRETPKIPSLGVGVGNGLMKERQVYTGTLIKGIATMHKSNAVPVINDEQAKDIAQMRRN